MLVASRHLRWTAPIALALGLAASSASCTLILDRRAEQCETNAECAAFPGTICSDDHVCTSRVPCAHTRECIEKLGEYHVCRKRDLTCVPITSEQCNVVDGDYTSDNAFIFGAIMPTEGDDGETGMAVVDGIKLALQDFRQTTNGLGPVPGTSVGARPMVLVACNDSSVSVNSVKAAAHLVDVGVPAIIGALNSGLTIDVATDVTIASDVLLFSPRATSAAITTLDDKNLVWRTAPSDVIQARAIQLYFDELVTSVRDGLMLPADASLKLAILHKGDAYGRLLAKTIESKLLLNGKAPTDPDNRASYLRFDYGNPDNPSESPLRYEAAVSAAVGLAPHLVMIFGTGEGVAGVLKPLEEQWPSSLSYRPRIMMSDGLAINALWEFVGKNDALRRRIVGSVPGTTNDLFRTFKADYSAQFNDGTSPDVFGAAGGYDATYLLAYSAISLRDRPITGPSLVEGLMKTIPPGPMVNVGPDSINPATKRLAAGGSIDFNGASGPLDFDRITGEAPSDILIWCLRADGTGAASGLGTTGRYYNAAEDMLDGTPQPCR